MARKTILGQRILKRISGSEHDPKVRNILHRANEYHWRLSKQGLLHYQVRYAVQSKKFVLVLLLVQLGKLFLAAILTAPGLVLFSPVLILANEISKSKARKAVAGSPFKVEGRDVLATWKVLAALTVSPVLYTFYFAVWAYLAYQCQIPPIPVEIVAWSGIVLLPAITLASMYVGDYIADTFRSFRPLLMLLDPQHAKDLGELFETQCRLTTEVKRFIDSPGFPDQKIEPATTYVFEGQLGPV